MSQDPWSQFAKAVRQQAQRANGAGGARPPKGLFAGIGGLITLGVGGLLISSSLYNGKLFFLFIYIYYNYDSIELNILTFFYLFI